VGGVVLVVVLLCSLLRGAKLQECKARRGACSLPPSRARLALTANAREKPCVSACEEGACTRSMVRWGGIGQLLQSALARQTRQQTGRGAQQPAVTACAHAVLALEACAPGLARRRGPWRC